MTRVLALVAVLCFGALQLQEAGHWHDTFDGYSQCLVCKTGTSVALPLNAPAQSDIATIHTFPLQYAAAPLLGCATPFQARGPPAYS